MALSWNWIKFYRGSYAYYVTTLEVGGYNIRIEVGYCGTADSLPPWYVKVESHSFYERFGETTTAPDEAQKVGLRIALAHYDALMTAVKKLLAKGEKKAKR